MDILTFLFTLLGVVVAGTIACATFLLSKIKILKSSLTELGKETEGVKSELISAKTKLVNMEGVEAELKEKQAALAREREDRASETATLKAQAEAAEATILELKKLRDTMVKDFEALAHAAVQKSHQSFLERAEETFKKHRQTFHAEGEKREERIDQLLKPVSDTLRKYEVGLGELEKQRQEHYGKLQAELRNVVQTQHDVRKETSKLVTALRAQPKTRGRWGEETLRNAMELAGMAEHCDFNTEKTIEVDTNKRRPDVIVHMPGGRSIVIDAKAPMEAFLKAIEATDESEKEQHLRQHANQVRAHVRALSSKNYWSGLSSSPDFVAMFLPSDNLFSAAVEKDTGLFDEAIAKNVLIVTPTTLIALVKAISYGWRQEKVAEDAQKIGNLGRDLYKRLRTLGEHTESLGKSLGSSVNHYNKFVGSLESTVLPQARKFSDLHIEGAQNPISELNQIETHPREIKSGELLPVKSE